MFQAEINASSRRPYAAWRSNYQPRRFGSNDHSLAGEPEVNLVPVVGVVVGRPGGEALEDAPDFAAGECFDMSVMEDDVRVAAMAPRGEAATRLALRQSILVSVGVGVKEDDVVSVGDDGCGPAQLCASGDGLWSTRTRAGPCGCGNA